MEIFVFKTNLSSTKLIRAAKPILQNIEGILRWNIDREDVDKVLRVEARNIMPSMIINAFNNAGFACEELPD